MAETVDRVLSEVIGKKLIGELLTIADAITGDKMQRDAIKSLIRQSCQRGLIELTSRLSTEEGLATKVEGAKEAGPPKQEEEKSG